MILYKFFIKIFCLVAVLSSFASTVAAVSVTQPSPTKEPLKVKSINSFELFWPVSAGRVMGDKLYTFKILKENLRGVFIFNDLKKAEYNITLSEKRTVEAEKLFLVNKDTVNGINTLSEAQKKRETALDLIMESKSKNTSDVKSRMINSFKNQKLLLEFMPTEIPEGQKSAVEENITSINNILKKLE